MIWNKKLSAKKYCILICILMIAIAGLRNRNLGLSDMVTGYLPGWHLVKNNSWSQVIKISLTGRTALKDIGYAVITKILAYGIKSDQWFIFISSVPYLVASTIFMYRHSKIIGLSFLMFIGLNYYTSSYYLVHHIWASTFLIVALECLLNEKKKMFIFMVIIASLFHASAIIFLILLVNYKKKLGGSQWFMIGSSLVVGSFGKNLLFWFLGLFISTSSRWYTYINGYTTDTLERFFLAFVCLLCAVLYERQMISREAKNIIFINLGVWCCVFYALIPAISEVHRFARYFGVVDTILVPNAIYECGNTKKRIMLSAIVLAIFSIYLFGYMFVATKAAPYFFFWEEYVLR